LRLVKKKLELQNAGLSESDFYPLIEAVDRAFTDNLFVEKHTKLLFKYADKDQNGQVTEDEYVAYMLDTAAQAESAREGQIILQPVLKDLENNVKMAMIQILLKILH